MDGANPQGEARKRSTLDIQMELVEKSNAPIVPTKLMYSCNLNYRTFHRLLDKCLACKFLSILKQDPQNGRNRFRVQSTDLGKEALKFYYQLQTKARARL